VLKPDNLLRARRFNEAWRDDAPWCEPEHGHHGHDHTHHDHSHDHHGHGHAPGHAKRSGSEAA
jgi:zinc/manganese transport system ATP-binding protein